MSEPPAEKKTTDEMLARILLDFEKIRVENKQRFADQKKLDQDIDKLNQEQKEIARRVKKMERAMKDLRRRDPFDPFEEAPP